MRKHIYIAEHEPNVQQIMQHFLEKAGYLTSCFSDGSSLLEMFEKEPADLVVMEANMPSLDGITLCQTLRTMSSVPVIVVSHRSELSDKLQGLQAGADDYLSKPFSPLELTARVKSLLRRVELDLKVTREKQGSHLEHIYHYGNVKIDDNSKQCYCNGKSMGLTTLEFGMLLYLIQNQNRAVSREELLEKVWRFETAIATRATDDVAKRIRKKMKANGADVYLETVWGYGFLMTQSKKE